MRSQLQYLGLTPGQAFFQRPGILQGLERNTETKVLARPKVMTLENETVSGQLARQYLESDLTKARPVSVEDAERYHRPSDVREQFRLGFSMSLDAWIGF